MDLFSLLRRKPCKWIFSLPCLPPYASAIQVSSTLCRNWFLRNRPEHMEAVQAIDNVLTRYFRSLRRANQGALGATVSHRDCRLVGSKSSIWLQGHGKNWRLPLPNGNSFFAGASAVFSHFSDPSRHTGKATTTTSCVVVHSRVTTAEGAGGEKRRRLEERAERSTSTQRASLSCYSWL